MPAEKKSFFDRFTNSSLRAGFSQLANEDPYNDVKKVGATESVLKRPIETNPVVLGGEAKKPAVVEAKQGKIVVENAKQASTDQGNLIVEKAALIIRDLMATRTIVAKAESVIEESNLTPAEKRLRKNALISKEEAYKEAMSPTIKLGQNKLEMMKGNPEITEDNLAKVEENISDIVADITKAVIERVTQEKRSGATEQAISYVEAGIESRSLGNEAAAQQERLETFTKPLLDVKGSMETASRVAKSRGAADAVKPIALTPDDETFIAETVQKVVGAIMRTEIIENALAKVEEDRAAAITPKKSNAGTKKVQLYNPSPEQEAEIRRLRESGQNKEAESLIASTISYYDQLVSAPEVRGATNKALQETEENPYERIGGGEQRDDEKKGESIYEAIDIDPLQEAEDALDIYGTNKAKESALNAPPPVPTSRRPSFAGVATPPSIDLLREAAATMGARANEVFSNSNGTPPVPPRQERSPSPISIKLSDDLMGSTDTDVYEKPVIGGGVEKLPVPPARQNTMRPPVPPRQSLVDGVSTAAYEVPTLRKNLKGLEQESSSDYEEIDSLRKEFVALEGETSDYEVPVRSQESDRVATLMRNRPLPEVPGSELPVVARKATVRERPQKPRPVGETQGDEVPLSRRFLNLGNSVKESSTDDVEKNISPQKPAPARKETIRKETSIDDGIYTAADREKTGFLRKKPMTSTSSLPPLREEGEEGVDRGSSWKSGDDGYDVLPKAPKAKAADHVYDTPSEKDFMEEAPPSANKSNAPKADAITKAPDKEGKRSAFEAVKALLPKNPFKPSTHIKGASATTFIDFLKKIGSDIVSAAINGRGGGR